MQKKPEILCKFRGCPAFGSGCTNDQIDWCPDYKINVEMINRGEIRRNEKCLNCGWGNKHNPGCPWDKSK